MRMADGLEEVALECIRETDPHVPDQSPFGEGLIERGGYISYVDGKKVGGDARVTRKPRDFRVRGQGAAVAAGYSFPARFQEMGTVHQPARPFFAPVVARVVGSGAVVSAMKRAFAGSLAKKAGFLARTRR